MRMAMQIETLRHRRRSGGSVTGATTLAACSLFLGCGRSGPPAKEATTAAAVSESTTTRFLRGKCSRTISLNFRAVPLGLSTFKRW